MNETLVHQQLSLHQLHHCHPSQRLTKRFFRLRDVTRSLYLRVLTALPRIGLMLRTVLRANITRELSGKTRNDENGMEMEWKWNGNGNANPLAVP